MKRLTKIIPAKEKWLSIVWQVNDFCNFRCTYCNEGNWGGRHRHENDIDTKERGSNGWSTQQVKNTLNYHYGKEAIAV